MLLVLHLQDCDMLISQLHLFFFFFLYILPCLIIKSAALKVGQEDGDLGVQSQLEPWSPIKCLVIAGSQAMASVCRHHSHPLIHTATNYVLFVMIIHVALAQLNTTAQRLSLNDP